MFKRPENTKQLEWTNHVVGKMLFYRLSANRVKSVVRKPQRAEKGIAPGTIAVMQKAGTNRPSEIWAMYQDLPGGKKRIITAWRYPGQSPKREAIPIPADIILELKKEGLIK
ncbi:MAG: hypothetical protein COU85_01050 [Candidatus Portnoybacteria bacterium CG10_big_fil_rev_8_21_14_0_10_44_7]|uniref:Uncharacterized protein n=1 Tax=Candidatus Portnoybacteria bacterium CG10_big_fil_rev_8_21_14_0_10_44_7 TaxID=1974816 RepID=A0A2M8KJ47_9BACT|nr:MAG: hypothetical protein COU85_01050 [Candidatus Portnoybacteria bacterium CG10_big_fil_rev_8_21_14_0_10_44_7]